MRALSARLAESQVDALPPQHGMVAVRERCDAMEEQPRRPAPHRDIAMIKPKPAWLVAALDAAEHEDGRQPQRDRDDRRAKIPLVLVLVQGHFCAGLVTVDQA